MPNNNVFNPLNLPVYTSNTNTYISPGIVAPPENSAGSTAIYTMQVPPTPQHWDYWEER